MKNTNKKKIFISYSHKDREFVERLAHALLEAGEDVWFDQWEILGGDSLVEKIFEEGLSSASAFVVVISPESVKSKWVREELDVATVRRIEGVTKVIPLVIGNAKIPSALRALVWIDMREKFDEGVQKIINSVHGITQKPLRPNRESIAFKLKESVGNLSQGASTIGFFIVSTADHDTGQIPAFSGSELSMVLGMDPQTINDSVDELEEYGMVRTLKTMGTAPYQFLQLEPTYVLYLEFSKYIEYDPQKDIQIVAATVASADKIYCQDLAEKSGLSPGRLNRAVEYLADYDLVQRYQTLGNYPFTFSHLAATRRTRQFIRS